MKVQLQLHRVALGLTFVATLLLPSARASANNTAQTLPFSQDWTNTGLITVDDNWSAVPGIEGFRGDGITGATGTDPQTLLAADDPGVIDVNANRNDPDTFTTGGLTEFQLANPAVALSGSGTADAPYLRLYLVTTGQSGVTISYQLRDLDGSADNSVQQAALHYRVGASGTFTNVAAAYVADASGGPSQATLVTNVCVVLPAAVDNQPLVQLRIMTTNAVGNDEWIGVDNIVVNTAGCAPSTPTLSINDVTLAEGNPPGTTTFTFGVTLSAPAGAGGVTFDIATADGTAQDGNPVGEDTDYVAQSLTGQTIPAGSTGPYNFSVTVNRDTTAEPNETFFVNVTNITGANVGDIQGQGTITNDDVTLTPIHDIQGPGASSPLSGSVTTRGIVTGVKSNGFFIQEPDASVDANPATSEGILIFTGGAPPAAAAVGNLVQVTGTISEFVPGADPMQPPLTELTAPSVSLVSSGNPLPAAIPLTPTFPDPAGVFDQLERLEGMRVSVASLTVIGPTLGSLVEANATSTSTGVFYGVVTGVARPIREAGIPAPDPAPSGGGTIPPIPRFDSNPERIRVDSDAQTGGPLIDVNSNAVVTGLVGPLDYSFRTYTIDPDPGATIVVSGGMTATAVTAPTGRELTVASYNMERFFDTVDDPGISDVALTAAAFDRRLAKASLAIRDSMRFPDIVGVEEMEHLTTLQALATRISTDAVAAAQPDPQYAAYLVEGNDIGGIDVGFLVKTAPVVGATPRVTVNAVVQENAGSLFVNPDASTELLNDRPTLRLMAVVNHANGTSFPVTVLVNHLRSLGSVNSEAAGSNGWSTAGARVRAKRQAQAAELANLIQARQLGDATERIVVVGDFNAFDVNDGLGHSMGVIAGTPVPDNETAVPGDGVDLVNPDLVNLLGTAPLPERYGYVFDGNTQNLDHILIDAPLVTATLARREEHARINSDFADTLRNDGTTPVRLSDHDPVVSYFEVAAFTSAALSVTKIDTPDPVTAGGTLAYTITVSNEGPDAAASVSLSDPLPAGTTFQSLSSPGGWSCTTPAVGATGTVACSIPTFPVGSADFTLTVTVDAGVANGTVISNTATAASTTADPQPGDETATADTTVASLATAVAFSKTDSPDPVVTGGELTYTITVDNTGLTPLDEATMTDPLPAGTSFVSLTPPAGWSCIVPPVGGTGTVSCSILAMPVGPAVFTLVVRVDTSLTGGAVVGNQAQLTVTDGGRTTTMIAAATTTTQSVLEIPTLGGLGLALLAMLLAAAAALVLRRRARAV